MLTQKSKEILNEAQIASEVNTLFIRTEPKLAQTVPHLANTVAAKIDTATFSKFTFSTISESAIHDIITKLNDAKAKRSRNISTRKASSNYLINPLTYTYLSYV